MRWIHQLAMKVRMLFGRSHAGARLDDELYFHIERQIAENVAAGMNAEEARYSALRSFGNPVLLREQTRATWSWNWLESVVQDVRYGLRGLRKSPGFTTVAMLTLTLGIGASTAIFSIVNTVLLRPLPFRDPSRLVRIRTVSSRWPEMVMGQTFTDLRDIEAQSHSFETIATFLPQPRTLTGSGYPEQLATADVSSGFLTLFGYHPALGRDFLPQDEQRQNGDVVLLSYGLWQRKFSGDPNIVGKAVTLDQQPFTVAGVVPPSFVYAAKWDALVAQTVPPEQLKRGMGNYPTLAKLRPGISLFQAQADLDRIAAGIVRQYPVMEEGLSFRLEPLQKAASRRPELLALLGAVGFLLLIACANVSNLVLSRGLRRQREIAVRAALGASRRRIVRQLLIESFLLALAGGMAGAAFAAAGVQLFRILAPANFPRLEELRAEPALMVIAFILSALAGILFGLAPAMSTVRANLNPAIRDSSAATSTPARMLSLRNILVVTEVALALVLLTGSGLMVQSMVRLLSVDTGLRTDRVLTGEVTLPNARYGSKDAQRIFVQRLLESLQSQSQFSGVALSNIPILSGLQGMITFDPSSMGINEEKTSFEAITVTPGFFETLGIRLQRGRVFSEHDVKGSSPVIIINDSVARRFFPGQDPIGRMLKFGPDPEDQFQIVGMVADTRDTSLDAGLRTQVYFSLLQEPSPYVQVLVRSSLDPATAISSLQRVVGSVDKNLPIRKARTLEEIISESVAQPRFRTWLLSIFAIAGLTLTLIGIYGVISYSVGQRTRELGIRMALGAQSGSLLGLVLRQAVVLAVTGAVCGVIGSVLLMRLLASQLFEIKPGDPVTLIGAALLMVIVALAASWIPARRATKVDPMIALRHE
ncbi:MAG TPA: ABC transporter permease [Candidatus Angelobacter sp.]